MGCYHNKYFFYEMFPICLALLDIILMLMSMELFDTLYVRIWKIE